MKQDLVFSLSLIPKECIPKRMQAIAYECLVQTGTFVHVGQKLLQLSFWERSDQQYYRQIGTYMFASPFEGYVYNLIGEERRFIRNMDLLCSIYSTLEEILSSYKTSYTLQRDPFSSGIQIRWDSVAGKGFKNNRSTSKAQTGFYIDNDIILYLTNKEQLPVLLIQYSSKYTKIRKKDIITFKCDDSTFLSFSITSAPGRLNDDTVYTHFISIPLLKNSVSAFAERGWELFRIEHANGDAPDVKRNRYRNECYPFTSILFRRYTEMYIHALEELGIELSDSQKQEEHALITPSPSLETCYVYLMVDTANSFYKIGISNHPEYREKTLQSEKPTIEKVCAKQFPSRLIAQSIESALHSAFSAKRVRGEWFNLSPEEVAQIIATLT